jgi:hypothetical protein
MKSALELQRERLERERAEQATSGSAGDTGGPP